MTFFLRDESETLRFPGRERQDLERGGDGLCSRWRRKECRGKETNELLPGDLRADYVWGRECTQLTDWAGSCENFSHPEKGRVSLEPYISQKISAAQPGVYRRLLQKKDEAKSARAGQGLYLAHNCIS